MGVASMSHATRFGAGAAGATEEYEFLRCGIGKTGQLVGGEGLRGSRSRLAEAIADGPYTVGGPVVLEPRPDDLDNWLPRILGAAEVADAFALAETLPDCVVAVDKVAKVYTYAGMVVNKANFKSSRGQLLTLEMDLQGKTETEAAAGSFPAIEGTLSVMTPYVHHQAVLTLNAATVVVDNIDLAIDNRLVLDRQYNSQSRLSLPASDRVVTLTCDNPFTSDETALYDMAVGGIAGTLVYTAGAYSLTFTFANLKAPARGPEVPGRGQEVPLRLELQAYKTAAGVDELAVTNVPV